MRQDDVAADLLDHFSEDGFLFPDYNGFCFANVPDTILSLFDAPTRRTLPNDVFTGIKTDADHVVVVLVDGFGYEQWTRDQHKYDFLDTLAKQGTVTPLTSTYPSETAAAITTVSTGTQPVEHGLLGWFQYYEELAQVLLTLPFSTLDGDYVPENFDGLDGRFLFSSPEQTVYERARDAGVSPHVVMPERISRSEHSKLAMAGASVSGYGDLAHMGRLIRKTLQSADGSSYTYAYIPHVDAVSHQHGTESPEYEKMVSKVTGHIQRELVERVAPAVAENTLLVVTADHGHLDTDPETNVALDTIDGLSDHLKRGPDGEPIPAVGSGRNLQFHVRDGHVEALRDLLEAELDVKTFDREEYTARGLFGDREPSAHFEAHAPDLVAVPRDKLVWYNDGELDQIGSHGGLSPEEMLCPFAVCRLASLQ
ncbi:alkaline phosphatase family protein [Haladaptatus sp. DJG-WS-42]|uniref:alkaline phosphatase family protein n=1 Tax=Haladaptatus sp. DJG-WS-42 TaxID=3120516 RepID=UPI0030D151CB